MDYIDWIKDNWGAIYGIGALVSGLLAAIIVFFGLWWFAAAKYALGGLVLGWLPGAIAAVIIGTIMGIGWPVLVPVAIWLANIFVPAIFDNRL